MMKKTVYIACGLAVVAGLAGCVSVITAANSVTPETTSMLYLGVGITEFDNVLVEWEAGSGIIIPSGRHTLAGTNSFWDPITYDFKPGRFYKIVAYFGSADDLQVEDITGTQRSDSYYAIKKKMQRIIAKAAGHNTTTAVTASRPEAQSPLSNRDIDRLQSALQKSAQTVMGSLNKQGIIAIVSVTSNSPDMAQFVAGELEVILVRNQFPVADRSRLDAVRQEQRLQLSGEVDDNTAVSIGKFAGAKVVIIGDISGSGSLRRLRLRALNTETALVTASASEAF